MRKFILAATLFSIISMPIVFAENPDSLSFKLDEVVVTSTRTPLMLKQTPVITRIITAKDIERRGSATLQQALENELAGVEFHQAGFGSSLSFQGLDARYVLFLVNGERMAGETYGNIDYTRIPMNNIERIEIVRGASSVLYGSNAMGAVVNIITKMPKDKVEVKASARYGTPFQRNGDETLGGDATPSDIKKYNNKLDLPNLKGDVSVGVNLGKFKSLTTASYRSVDAYKLVGTKDEIRHYDKMQIYKITMAGPRPDRTALDTTISAKPDSRGLSVSGWQDYNISQRFDYVLSDKFRFEVSGNYFRRDRYDFNASILDENPMPNPNKEWSFETYSGYNAKFLLEHSPNDKNKIYLSFMRDEYYRNQDFLGEDKVRKQNHIYNIPRLLWTLDAGKYNRLTTGLELVNEQLRFDLNADPAGYKKLESMNTASLYVQDEILYGRKLSFVVGARVNYNDNFGWSFTPKASAKVDLGKFSIRANYANGFRTPSLKEMYMTFNVPIPGAITQIRGNADLKPETNNYVSLSGEFNTDGFNASATMYNSFYRNKIDVRGHMEGTTTVLQYQNINRSEFAGLELMARARLAKSFFVKANYNYIYQTDDAPEESTQYIYPSPHTATLSAEYGFNLWNSYVGVNATARYVGPKNYEDFMPIMTVKPSPMGPPSMSLIMGNYTACHEGYMLVNAAVNVEIKRMFTVTLGVDNIFNYKPEIINFNSAINPGRNMFVSLSYAFNHK